MAKAIDIINDAMYAIGASSDINPASPELQNAAFRRLIQWMIQLQHSGIPLGLDETNLPTEPGTELGNDPAFDLSLAAGLTVWIAPLFQIAVSIDTRGAADQAMDFMYINALKADPPEYPETLPIGSGNERGPKSRVYFPAPEDPFEPDVTTP